MGLMLIAALFAGCVLGLMVTALPGGAGVMLAVKMAKSRRFVWWGFGLAFVIVLALCLGAVQDYPYGAVSPGSDYDVAMKNFFIEGVGYGASPGLAALLAGLATRLMPRKPAPPPAESPPDTRASHDPRG